MKHLIALMASVLCVALGVSSCSSEDKDPVDPYPDHIGISESVIWFIANGDEKEITTESDGWTLSEVGVVTCDEVRVNTDWTYLDAHGNIYDSQYFRPEIMAHKPFEYALDNVTFSYSDKKIKITASDREDADHEVLYEFTLTKGDCTETIYCNYSLTEAPERREMGVYPSEFSIPAEGGSYTSEILFGSGITEGSILSLRVGDHWFPDQNIILSNNGHKWYQDFKWLSLEFDGNGMLTIDVQPNDADQDRIFYISVSIGEKTIRISGTQAAK